MFKNKEVKYFTITYVAVFIVLGILLAFLMDGAIDNMEKLYYEELISSTKDESMLWETGRLDYLPSQYSQRIRSSIIMLYGVTFSFYLLLGIIGYLFGIRLYKVPLKSIKTVTANAENVFEGDFNSLDMGDIDESDISMFLSMYTKMVTAIRQSKDKEESEKVFLQDLIADISHQLKTPLATLTIYQDLLCNPAVSEDKKQEVLGLMGKQLSRMEWLILSLLKLARLEAGAIEFTMEKKKLLPTIQMAHQNVSALLKAKNQQISINCDDSISVNHDVDWTAEALTNILKNATEYAPTNSTIELNVKHSQVMTNIEVKDYGKGIDSASLPHIFKRFYRAKSDVNENSIGIGLSLSKGIMKGQGGDITVCSEVNKYTAFTLSFFHI